MWQTFDIFCSFLSSVRYQVLAFTLLVFILSHNDKPIEEVYDSQMNGEQGMTGEKYLIPNTTMTTPMPYRDLTLVCEDAFQRLDWCDSGK